MQGSREGRHSRADRVVADAGTGMTKRPFSREVTLVHCASAVHDVYVAGVLVSHCVRIRKGRQLHMEPNVLIQQSHCIRQRPQHRGGLPAAPCGLTLCVVLAALCLAGCGVIPGTAPLGSSSSCGTSSQAVHHMQPGEAGLYAAAVDGIYRFQARQGHLTLIWYAPYPALQGAISSPAVLTPVAVGDDEAFVAIQAAGGENIDIDALSTLDGSRLWRTTISGSEISNLFVSQQTVYLETDAPGGIVIRALNDQNGSQRWSQTFPVNEANTTSGYFPGLGDVASGVVYATNDNNLLALDATTGKLLWQQPTDTSQTFLPPAVMDGILYDNAYSVENGPSVVYAFDPANGRELWQTAEFGPTADSLNETIATEATGLVYYGSTDGSIYAVSARNGTPVWHASMTYVVNAPPAEANGVVYIGGAPGNGVNPNISRGEVLALDAATGKQLWSYSLPTVGYNGAYPLIVSSGVVYVVTGIGSIYSVNAATGSQIAQLRLGGECSVGANPALTVVG